MPDTPADTGPSGIALLAADGLSFEDGPFPVRGVALPEDIVTSGANSEGVDVYWPPDTVEGAAAEFDGAKITDPSEHDPESAAANPQPSPETIIGEITAAEYEPGVGVVYEGEVDDPEIAKRIHRERVDVSPTLYRALGDEHPERDAMVASDVGAVRDLSVVAEGAAAGNSIEPATAALMATALAEAFDHDETTGAESPADATGTGDDPAGASSPGRDDSSRPMEDELTEHERELLAAARQLDDPDVVSAATVDRLDTYEALLDAADETDDPTVVAASDYETLRERVDTVEELMAEALQERTGLSDAAIDAMPFEAMAAEFETDDGDLDLEALAQEPETGGAPNTPDLDGEAETLAEEWGDGDRDAAIATLRERHENFTNMDWESHAAETADKLEQLGVEP